MRVVCVAGALAFAASVSAGAETYQVDRKQSEVSFQISHMVGKVRGRFTSFGGQIDGDPARPEQARVEFAVRTASINTALPRRDEHLRGPDFFDAKAHPDLVFKSTKIVPRTAGLYDVNGTLMIRGVRRPVVLPVRMMPGAGSRGGDVVRFEIETTLDRTDYGIVWNKVLGRDGVLLGNEVDVRIRLVAVRSKVTSMSAVPPAP